MKKKILFAWAILTCSTVVNATITTVGPFSGQFSEGFETQPSWVSQISVFESQGVVRELNNNPYVVVTYLWRSQDTGDAVTPHGGGFFMGAANDGDLEWVFDTPAERFGGYFVTLNLPSNSEGAIAVFFDFENSQIGEMDVIAPYNSQWTWNGWISDIPIKRVQILGIGPPGGHVMHDDMQYTPIPEPGVLLLFGFGGLALLRKHRAK